MSTALKTRKSNHANHFDNCFMQKHHRIRKRLNHRLAGTIGKGTLKKIYIGCVQSTIKQNIN